jgi:chromosome partitioning protein
VSSDEGGEVMRTIAIVNQKGGCGKTTTAINLSACLAQKSKKVLLVDLDPQSNASIGLKVKVEDLDRSIYDIFSQSHDLKDVIITIDQYLHLVPSQLILSAVEQELAGKEGRESVLFRTMNMMKREYDYIIIDCPPSLGLLTFNALRACREALIPIEMSVFSLQGVARLLEVIEVLKTKYNHEIHYKVLATICNARTVFAAEVLENMRKHFSKNMYKTIIHATVRLKESAGYGLPINKYDKRCKGTIDYCQLADEVVSEEKRLRKDKSASYSVGPRQTKEGVLFSYYDPSARDVQLVGDFSDWEPLQNSMIQDQGKHIWTGVIPLEAGTYQYKFIVDGEWKIDPDNAEVVTTSMGARNSAVNVS